MTRDQMLADLYSRVTSRTLLLCLLSIGFAMLNYHNGALTAVEFQGAVMAAVTVYSVAKAAEKIATRQPAPAPMVTVETAPDFVAPLVGRLSAEALSQVAGELEKRMRGTPADPGALITRSPTWLAADVDSTATAGLPVTTARTGD